MNAIQIADSFDLYAADHTPDGWPAVQQKQLTEAALMLRKQQNAIVRLRGFLESIQRMSYDNSAQAKACSMALADTEEYK